MASGELVTAERLARWIERELPPVARNRPATAQASDADFIACAPTQMSRRRKRVSSMPPMAGEVMAQPDSPEPPPARLSLWRTATFASLTLAAAAIAWALASSGPREVIIRPAADPAPCQPAQNPPSPVFQE